MLSLPPVDQALAEARHALKDGTRRISVSGPQGAGKSTVLTRLARQWPLPGPQPLYVGLTGDDDAGMCALGGLASRLFVYEPSLDRLIRDLALSFEEKLERVAQVVGARHVPLLLDDPLPLSSDEALESAFALQSRLLRQRLLETDTVVVCASTRPLAPRDVERIELRAASHVESVLGRKQWNGLGSVAAELMKHAPELVGYSPLELRLSVLLASLKGVGVNRLLGSGWRLVELLDELFRRLPNADSLKKLVARLALVRQPITDGRLRELTKGADKAVRKVLEDVLLFDEDGLWLVHEAIAAEARRKGWLTPDELRKTHRELADHSRALFKAAAAKAELASALRLELDTVHHRTEAADATLLDDTLVFVEQYDNCGRRLGIEGVACLKRGKRVEGTRLLGQAVKAYERALAHNEHDWYASHYLAFNLDLLGKEPARVAAAYLKALEERPVFVWSHSRYLRFLVTTGQLRAFRAAWEGARRDVLPSGTADNPKVYEELHCDVATTLLYFAQPALARLVLDGVPDGARSLLARYKLLEQLVVAQEEALRDELVFPPWIAPADRWNGPHLLPNDQRSKVARWIPARVASVQPSRLRLRVATQVKAGSQLGWRTLSAADVERLDAGDLREGLFVELVELQGTERLFRHQPTGDYFKDVTPRFPAPDRFSL